MRRTSAVILGLLVCMLCSGQKRHRCMGGIDLSSIARENVLGLYSGISAGSRWSVCAAAFIRLPDLRQDEATISHREALLLEMPAAGKEAEDLMAVQICAQYWMKDIFRGPAISFGLMSSHSRNIEVPLSAAYVCEIWKGLRAGLSYDIYVLETILKGQFHGKGLCLGLAYEF